MENLPKVAVVMSTYNGEKYIKQQIESILNQVDVNLRLYIRDDGSTDNTLSIVKSFIPSGKVQIVPGGINLGYGLSFMKILYFLVEQKVDFDYYAFADQDDIWLDQKLDKGIELLKEFSGIPALYVSDQILYKEGKELGLCHPTREKPSLAKQIYSNDFFGCTMIFNICLLHKLPPEEQLPTELIFYRGHDLWLLFVALLTGKVIYDDNSYILYRIHEKNVVGNQKNNLFQRIQRRSNLEKNKNGGTNLRKKTAEALLELYPDISAQDRDVLEKYAYYQDSFRNKWHLLKDRDLIRAAKEKDNAFMFRMLVLFNII